MDRDYLLHLNVNRDTLQESKVIKVISKKLVRKDIEMLCNIAEKDESKKEKDDYIDVETKEVELNKVAETVNDKLVVDAANDDTPPQDAMTTTTVAAAEEGRDNDDVGAEDGDDYNEADNTKEGEEGGAI